MNVNNMIVQIINRFFQYTPLDTDTNVRNSVAFGMFAGGVLGYCLFAYLVFGHSLFSGEPFWETAPLYFHNADGRISQFLVKDFGYLVWPQQIIAWFGYFLSVPSRDIPNFYNGVATLITGMMIFCFCLPRFRCLISSDLFRLVFCITFSCVATAETREFINFTYYSAFFITIICAMMMVAKPDKLPWYVKTLPIWFVAKPAILAVFPILVISLFYTKRNYQIIIGLCFVAVMIQLVNVYSGSYNDYGAGLAERFITFIEHTRFQITVIWHVKYMPPMPIFAQYILAIGTLASLLYVCYTWKNPVKLLIVFGLVVIFGSNFIVLFGLRTYFFTSLQELYVLGELKLHRWTITQIIGMVMIAGALCVYFSEKIGKYQLQYSQWYASASVLFIIWLGASGWGYKIYETNSPTDIQWQNIAWQSNHDEGVFDKVCTSIRTLAWVYNPDDLCVPLGRKYGIGPIRFGLLPNTEISLLKPEDLGNRLVQSIVAVYQVPEDHPNYQLTLQVNDQIVTKTIKPISRISKNMVVQFNLPTPVNGEDIYEISIKSSIAIDLSTHGTPPLNKAHAYWYVKNESPK